MNTTFWQDGAPIVIFNDRAHAVLKTRKVFQVRVYAVQMALDKPENSETTKYSRCVSIYFIM